MKAKKFFLEYEDAEEFEVLAVCSHHPDYRLVWNMNKHAELELQRSETLYEAYSKKGEFLAGHVQFKYVDETQEIEYLLLKNKEQRNILVPELGMVDYLLFIATQHQYPTDRIRKKLSESDSIIAVYKIDPTEIKSLSRLEVFN
jgi:hypothetical protein